MRTTLQTLIAGAFGLWLALGPGPGVAAAQETELTLEQVLQVARQRNPSINASEQDVAVSQAQLTQSRSSYLPQVSYQAGYDRQWSEFSSSRQTQSGAGTGQFNSYSSDLSLSQYLYDFGQTRGKVEKSEHSLTASQKNLVKSVADVVRDVSNAYYEILKQRDLVGVQEESLRTQEAHLVQAQAFYKAGTHPKIDVTKSEVLVANTNLQLVQVRYAFLTAKVNLEKLLGGPPVAGEYRLASAPQTGPAPPELEPLIKLAQDSRPENQALEAQIKAAEAGLRSAEAAHWPTISAQGAYGWDSTAFPLEESWLAGATLNIPIFTGLRLQGQVSEAKANLMKLQAQLRQQKLQVAQEVSSAVLQVRQALESTSSARVALRQAQEGMDLADGRWRVGVGNTVEYSDAQFTLVQAKSNLVQALYQYWQAMTELDHALGRGAPL